MRSLRSLAIAAFAAGGIASAAALTIDPAQHAIDGVRNARYCEIIPVVRSGFHLLATVYNTLGVNDCPAAVWDKITEAEMKKRFGAIKVLLNGPRHFVMDKIVAGGETAAGEKIEAGGLELTERASIDLDLFGMRSEPYRERTIDRDTRYRRQALRHAGLRADDRQELVVWRPAGLGRAPEATQGLALREHGAGVRLVLGAHGEAIIVQDDLDDTYQKLD
jgi:hypothetical protein